MPNHDIRVRVTKTSWIPVVLRHTNIVNDIITKDWLIHTYVLHVYPNSVIARADKTFIYLLYMFFVLFYSFLCNGTTRTCIVVVRKKHCRIKYYQAK